MIQPRSIHRLTSLVGQPSLASVNPGYQLAHRLNL